MITEDYCSYEVAKLLKEKGFDWECEHVIWEGADDNYENYDKAIPNPTHQMAMKWLREVHHIHIGINPISGEGYNATIYDVADFDDCGIISDTESFFHVEEACEAALKYSLKNLI